MRPGDVLDGRYTLEVLVGTGGMGAVYRAKDAQTGRPVAVKILRGYGVEVALRFQREAELLAQLAGPNIVGYHAIGTSHEGDTFMVLEWLEGETLRDRLERAPLTLFESLSVVAGIAEALGKAHDLDVVHRDLKPANVYLVDCDPARVKVLDFGIARVLREEKGLTLTGDVLGTPGYMSPEQIRGDKQLDERCDVYAMGCILFRCLTGHAPFEANDTVALLMATATNDAPRVRDLRPAIDPRVDALCAAMLRRVAAERPSDARQVAAELGAMRAALRSDLEPPPLEGTGLSPLSLTTGLKNQESVPLPLAKRRAPADNAPLKDLPPPSVELRPAKWRWALYAALAVGVMFVVGFGITVAVGKAKKAPAASGASAAAPPPSSAPALASAPPRAGHAFVYQVEAPKDPELAPYQKLFEHKRIRSIIDNLDKNILLPDTVGVSAKQCGAAVTLYRKEAHRVDLCYELARDLHSRFGSSFGATEESAAEATLDAITFVTLHHLGHAVLAEADLAVTGDEEAAVDEFATLLLIDMGRPEWLLNATTSMVKANLLGAETFAIEHAIARERVEEMHCLVYGSDPAKHANVPGDILPAPRAASCPDQYKQKDKAWSLLLRDHLRNLR